MSAGFRKITITDQAAWQDFIAPMAFAYSHTWDYGKAISLGKEDSVFLLAYQEQAGRVACPLMERSGPEGSRHVVTPYGYGGLISFGTVTRFFEEWPAYAGALGYVCGYIALNPAIDPGIEIPQSDLFSVSEVFILDLDKSIETIRGKLSKNILSKLKEWEKAGAKLVFEQTEAREAFLRIYPEFIKRIGADVQYHFSPQTLKAITESPNATVIGSRLGSKIVAASIFTHTVDCGDYLLSASLPEGRSHSAALLWAGIEHIKRRGVPVINMGGGIQPGDGLSRFKSRFNAKRKARQVLKQVYDKEAYDHHCQAKNIDRNNLKGFFPPYAL